MKAVMETGTGAAYELPQLLQWEISLTGSVPCDSFSVSCLYERDMHHVLPEVIRFSAVHENETVFCGVVDEYLISEDQHGRMLTLNGRGMAALLVDNESEAVSYESADLREIFRNHASPYGFSCSKIAELRGTKYRVDSGSSQWKALSRFTEYYGGFSPTVTSLGELILVKEEVGTVRCIDRNTPILALRYRERRYGVFSEVLVKDRVKGTEVLVENRELKRTGGSCRRVIYMPRKSSFAAMRYTGEYQIRKSREEQLEIELLLPGVFLAQPGDLVTLQRGDLGIAGTYRVKEAESRSGAEGELCTLVLRER